MTLLAMATGILLVYVLGEVMRSTPDANDEADSKELLELHAEPWQIAMLQCNSGYVRWGPGEEYMATKNDEYPGWGSSVEIADWDTFTNDFMLNDLNQCANFHFFVERTARGCTGCLTPGDEEPWGGNGEHQDAKWVTNSWYEFYSPFTHRKFPALATIDKYGEPFRSFCREMKVHKAWKNRLTQDEVDALMEHDRLFKGEFKGRTDVTAEELNAANYDHDAINSWICKKVRVARMRIPMGCPECDGSGQIYTAPKAHLGLTLWWLHPRKGASRGVRINRIEEYELPAVKAFLLEAAERNADRFAKVSQIGAFV